MRLRRVRNWGFLTFVDDVPSCADVLVTAGHGLDVVLHDLDQRGVVESAAGDPLGKLAVPDQGMAVDLDLVLLRERGDLVGFTEREVSSGRFGGLPFHGVLGSDTGVWSGPGQCWERWESTNELNSWLMTLVSVLMLSSRMVRAVPTKLLPRFCMAL